MSPLDFLEVQKTYKILQKNLFSFYCPQNRHCLHYLLIVGV